MLSDPHPPTLRLQPTPPPSDSSLCHSQLSDRDSSVHEWSRHQVVSSWVIFLLFVFFSGRVLFGFTVTSFFLVRFEGAVVTHPASEPARSADVESLTPSPHTVLHARFTLCPSWSFVPRSRIDPEKRGCGVSMWTAMLFLSAPVSRKNKCGGLKRRLSLCGQSGITLSALQAAQTHVSALARVPLSPWICVCLCAHLPFFN